VAGRLQSAVYSGWSSAAWYGAHCLLEVEMTHEEPEDLTAVALVSVIFWIIIIGALVWRTLGG